MATASRKNPFESFEAFQSSIDLKAFNQIQQDSFSAFTEANRTLLNAFQKGIRTQSQFFQEQAEAAANIASQALSVKSPEENIDTHTRFAQHCIEAGVQNAQTVAENATKASVEAFDILNKQALSNLNELTKLSKKAS